MTTIPTPDPLHEAAVQDGHRHLLDTFRSFWSDVEAGGELDLDGLRGAVAFLRQSLLPFARWEEEGLAADPVTAEETAFEHAFLAVEIDALAAAVARLAEHGSTSPGGARAAAAVRRSLYRLEAVLELHVSKAEDRAAADVAVLDAAGGPAAPRAEAAPASAGGPTRPRELTAAEIDAVLRGGRWAFLCTAADGWPYAVPVSYGYDGHALYVATAAGRKLREMERNPRACLTVADIRDGDRWSSVVVQGWVEPVDGLAARAAALRCVQRQRRDGVISATDLRRAAGARVVRIVPTATTGRARG